MYQRFAKAMRVAVREEGFAQIFGTGVLLVIIGTPTYTTSQDWSLVDGFYFAVATLTTSSIADPDLVITGAPIKIFTVFYILVGIGILVELVRQIGSPTSRSDEQRKRRKTPRPTRATKPTRNPPSRAATRMDPHIDRLPLQAGRRRPQKLQLSAADSDARRVIWLTVKVAVRANA
jgi:Ion channel